MGVRQRHSFEGVGSKDREFKIANLFRKHKSWKRLVLSNGRGDYRLADA